MAKEDGHDQDELNFGDEGTPVLDDADGKKDDEGKQHQDKPKLEVEVVDDTPDEDRRVIEARKKKQDHDVELPPLPSSEDDLDKEIAEYGKRSQKRIKQLYSRYHDERRVAEEAQRQREEAIRYAQNALAENRRLQDTLSKGEVYLVEKIKEKAKLTLDAAKKQYKEAFESGDAEKIASATEAMSSAVAESREAERFKPASTLQQEKRGVESDQQKPGSEHRESQQQQQRVPPDPRAVKWAESNKWFGSDKTMTAWAYGFHQQLVVEDGVDPRSDEYYERIDKEVRKRFPEKFESPRESRSETRSARSVVAGVSRTPSSKKVTLTATQAALAKRLGVPLELYAEQVLKGADNA